MASSATASPRPASLPTPGAGRPRAFALRATTLREDLAGASDDLAEPARGPPVHARISPAAVLRFTAGARKRPGSPPAARFEAHCTTRAVGVFFLLHPGPSKAAMAYLADDLHRGLDRVPGFSPPRGTLLRSVRLATSPACCSLRQDSPRSALLRAVCLPAPSRLRWRMGAYHL